VLYRPLKLVFFALLGILPAALSAQTPPLPATLPEDLLPGLRQILHAAMEQSPQMVARNVEIAAQEANRYQQVAPEWPSVSSGFGYIDYHSAVSVGKTFASSSASSQGPIYNLILTQPIYHWGALQAAADIGHLNVKISERQYADGYRQLAATIRSQYLSLIIQKVQMRNLRFALDQTKTSLGVVEARFKNGAATSSDETNAHMAVDDTSLALDRTAEDFAHAKRLLQLTVGLTELSDDSVPEEIPKPVYSAAAPPTLLQDFERDGVHKTFQAQVYDYQIRESELNYKIAKYRLFPRLDLGFSLSEQYQAQGVSLTNGQAGITEKQYFYNDVTLSASWNIFDGFATRGAKLAALASKRANERNLQTYLDQTLEQARYMGRQVEFSARALALTEERFGFAVGNLQRVKDNLKLGVGSQGDVDQATANFYQWQAIAFSARIDFFSRWSDYLSLLNIDPVLNNIPAYFNSNAK
jgi:outer membrane protein TolC